MNFELKKVSDEYIDDAVDAGARDKNLHLFDFSYLRDNSIYVAGHNQVLVSRISESFRRFSDTFELNMKVSDDTDSEELSGADYILYTGYTNEIISDNVPDGFIAFLDKAANSGAKHFIFISDYRVYKTDSLIYHAEHEHVDTDSPYTNLENIVSTRIINAGMSLVIIRPGMLFGPGLSMPNVLTELAVSVASGEERLVKYDETLITPIFINDFISAIFHSILIEEQSDCNPCIVNACTDEELYNIEQIVAMIRKEFPDSCNLYMTKSDENSIKVESPLPIANHDKLKVFGWKNKVPFIDGMIILIRSIISSENGEDEIFTFDKAYQGKLQTVHNILLGYMLMIDKICKKHDIKYFLAGGTLLGAIRHHGFIPWDDDADIMMTRDDYDKFMKILPGELDELLGDKGGIFIQTPYTEALNHQPFTKLRLDDTYFSTKFTAKFPNMHNGIFIDILAHDRTAYSKLARKFHLAQTIAIRSMVFNKWNDSPIITGGTHPALCKLGTMLKDILPQKMMDRRMFYVLTKYKHRKPGFLYDGMGRNVKRGDFPEEWLDESIYVDFEDYKLPVPKEYDKYLTWLYGDYMKMIPVSERRVSHSIVWMDLGYMTGYGDNPDDIKDMAGYIRKNYIPIKGSD